MAPDALLTTPEVTRVLTPERYRRPDCRRQPALRPAVGTGVTHTRSMSEGERASEYMEKNPRVETAFVDLGREWKRRTGRSEIGVGALCERVRWEIAVETSDPDFKINNNFRAYYARKIMAEYPDLDGLFKLRSSAADEWLADRLAALDADEHGRFSLFPEQRDGRNR